MKNGIKAKQKGLHDTDPKHCLRD